MVKRSQRKRNPKRKSQKKRKLLTEREKKRFSIWLNHKKHNWLIDWMNFQMLEKLLLILVYSTRRTEQKIVFYQILNFKTVFVLNKNGIRPVSWQQHSANVCIESRVNMRKHVKNEKEWDSVLKAKIVCESIGNCAKSRESML